MPGSRLVRGGGEFGVHQGRRESVGGRQHSDLNADLNANIGGATQRFHVANIGSCCRQLEENFTMVAPYRGDLPG